GGRGRSGLPRLRQGELRDRPVDLRRRGFPDSLAQGEVIVKIGHTGITWRDLEEAYRDVAELGYMGFETFTKSIVQWNREKPGGYRALVDRVGLPTVAGYCYKDWINPETAGKDMSEAKVEADALRALPGG